jgi:hypothetical protein
LKGKHLVSKHTTVSATEAADRVMTIHMVRDALRTAFWAAVLVGGDSAIAEAAVLQGIEASEDVSSPSFLTTVVSAAIRGRATAAQGRNTPEPFPSELHPLFLLTSLDLDCFVLRFVLGFTSETCALVLQVTVEDFNTALYSALGQISVSFSLNQRISQ